MVHFAEADDVGRAQLVFQAVEGGERCGGAIERRIELGEARR